MANYPPAKPNPMNSHSYEFSLPDQLKEEMNIVEIVEEVRGGATNITIKIGNERFRAHKKVLEHWSPVLKAMLSDIWIVNNANLELSEQFVDPSIFRDILNFFYTTKITLTNENCHSLSIAANYLNIPLLLPQTEEFLFYKVNDKNDIFALFLHAERFNFKILRQRCIDVIRFRIRKNGGGRILRNDPRLANFSEDDVKSLLSELNDPREYHLYCFCRYGMGIIKKISHINPLTKKWKQLKEPLIQRESFGGTVVGDKIYLCGGFRHNAARAREDLKSMDVFDCVTGTLKPLPEMPQCRRLFGMAELNGYLYVAGGIVDQSSCNSVLRYSIEERVWQSVSEMLEPRSGHHLVALNGYLYAICGYEGQRNNRYCPKTDQWSRMANTRRKHYHFGVAVHYDKIYVYSDSFEVYNPLTNTWRVLPTYRQEPSPGSTLLSMDGRLLLVGSEGGGSYNTVQEFDILTEQWTPALYCNVPRNDYCSFVLRF